MEHTDATIDRLLNEVFTVLGFTDAQVGKAKDDLDRLIKMRVIEALVVGLNDDATEAFKAKAGSLSVAQLEGELASTLMSVYSKEQVTAKVQAVTETVIAGYLDFMLSKTNEQRREKLHDILSGWRSAAEQAAG